ncbi:exodeoxyribonuclease V subunit alpha [Vibrio genomosp. F10]|uniref:exodeoxyribonuclease V subunit alpha n=1 Tax=Vibrio genomosp. F10 TaxID=723171 RepID=UPI0002F7D6C9|nr:exodeoxyribonuclease V subunit alpha [Vibrio genomosp. F10]OEF09095.1 exodeoxyribonuclease V subunit alpha [Vibrio genomosp. F10 str. 9ZB36]
MTMSLLSNLNTLAKKGVIRQLDYQFARFIASQEQNAPEQIGFLAGLISHELSKGNICLMLPTPSMVGETANNSVNSDEHAHHPWALKLGLYGDSATALSLQLQSIDWASLIQQSTLIGENSEAVPMMFDGERLYLHRYWQYEIGLAECLTRFGSPMILKPTEVQNLSALLDRLFQRSYHYLFNGLKSLSPSKNTQVVRQQLVCDHLDIVDNTSLDWMAIDNLLLAANKSEDLKTLDQWVPLSVCVNWQKVAASIALTRRFAVISGGPGTGKTTTVTKLLAALITQAEQTGKEPTIRLVAPTGKAAARLTESIGQAITELAVSPQLKEKIPTQASTIHRLLGALPNSAEFRHNRANPLHLDILVIDEASMVDLPMMYKVVEALPDHARLILLGDKDQLASVEAGSVLGDICSFQKLGYSRAQEKVLKELTQYQHINVNDGSVNPDDTIKQDGNVISDSLCMLQKSFRFDARSGIGQLAKAINSGQPKRVEQVFEQGFGDIESHTLSGESYNHMLQTLVQEYAQYLKQIQPKDTSTIELVEDQLQRAKMALKQFAQCRLLCAIREGDFGVSGLNLRIEKALSRQRLINPQDELWYHGRPVMVTQNDHGLGLYNGDIGICMIDFSDDNKRLKVFFELPDGSVKSVLPSRVPSHETAFAMTVHKSQGSEFALTLMILPPDFTPVLTRELIYTGITRAKSRLVLFCNMSVLKRGIRVKTERASGLVERLKMTC